MKNNRYLKYLGLAAVALLLACATTQSRAQTLYTNALNTTADLTSWIYWYNVPGGNKAMQLDPVGDGMEVDNPFAGLNTQNVFFGTFHNGWGYDFTTRLDLTKYQDIEFNIKMAPGTPLTTAGNYGTIGVGMINASTYGYEEFSRVTIPAAAGSGWVRLIIPIAGNPTALASAGATACPGIAMSINTYGGAYSPTIDYTNYINDLAVNPLPYVPGPPTMKSVKPAVNGLNCIATVAANGGNRYSICTTNTTGYGPNSGSTVTYTWNIASFANNDPYGFQGHFMISCGADSSVTNSNGGPGPYDESVDWNWGNVIFVTIQGNPTGGAYMNFRYKTNQPGANGQLWATLWATVGSTTPIGQWSVSITPGSGLVTITSPQSSANFTMDAASLALFQDPLALTLGCQPNDVNGDGQAVVYSSFTATGCATPINENFTTESQLSSVWFILAQDPNGIQLVPPGSYNWLSWTLPDAGYSPQSTSNLLGLWTDITNTPFSDNGNRQVLYTSPGTQGFGRLIQRTFTQLQVLLPGETSAPGTPTGKTGTPTPVSISAGGNEDVTVNAVDSTWHIVNGVIDTISLTSSDGLAILPLNAAMVNGTVTFSGVNAIAFGTQGSQTITATDTTSTNITAAISSPVTVGP